MLSYFLKPKKKEKKQISQKLKEELIKIDQKIDQMKSIRICNSLSSNN